ncbi:MAG: hypothetical protein H0V25_04755 [Solirubrobacterales bacterium]|nr:hypothetical protein [Solirubrobacterales bacterium]
MRRVCAAALVVLAAATVAGCGSEDFPNDPRPSSPVELSAKIDDKQVVLAPDSTGAGLAVITVSNQSADDVQLDFSGPSNRSTNEIAAGSVGTVQIELKEGDYSVDPSVSSISGGTLKVGADRPSAQNDLLLP